MSRQRRTAEDWRRAVFASGVLSDRTKVLLLLMADHMGTHRKVSVPRSTLAAKLGKTERRITERITEAHRAGFLSTISAGYVGHTAVYEGTFPDAESGRDVRPLSRAESGTSTSPLSSAETRPLSTPERGRDVRPPYVGADLSVRTHGRDGGSNDKTEDPPRRDRLTLCRWQHATCPDECADHPSTREESA